MTRPSTPDFLVLHALRLKGFADTPVVAALAGLDENEALRRLEKAASVEHVTRRDGRISGWALTPVGRATHKELVRQELEEHEAREPVEAGYQQFLSVNGDLLEVCTAWQLRNGTLNDHLDPAYDAEVIARLRRVDEFVQPVCAALGDALDRFQHYAPRLDAARRNVEGGDVDWFAKPMIDSYHSVWFELHEDLLVTLGIERAKEGRS